MYQSGNTAFIIENNRTVRIGKIVQERNGMYLFSFLDGGGIWIRRNRIYPTWKDAETAIPKREARKTEVQRMASFRNHMAAILG